MPAGNKARKADYTISGPPWQILDTDGLYG